jgi:hypothetical protein
MASTPATTHGRVATPAEVMPGRYITDGRRLLRVVSQFGTDLCPFAELEDCLTLEVHTYSPKELYRIDLWPVRTHVNRTPRHVDNATHRKIKMPKRAGRIATLVKAKISTLLDRAEEPAQTLDDA